MEFEQNGLCADSHIHHSSCSHPISAFPKTYGHDGGGHGGPLESLERALKSVMASIRSSKHTAKALAGAVVGLRGSAAHETLVSDASTAVKDLQRAHQSVAKAHKIVADVSSPPTDTDTNAQSEADTEGGNTSESVAESSVPLVGILNVHTVLIKRYDYRKFIYSRISVSFTSAVDDLVNA